MRFVNDPFAPQVISFDIIVVICSLLFSGWRKPAAPGKYRKGTPKEAKEGCMTAWFLYLADCMIIPPFYFNALQGCKYLPP
jgi:hypothetical protein